MITFSIIQKSQLEGAMRMDAEFFHPEKLEALTILERHSGKNISDYFFSSKKTFNPISQKLGKSAIVYDLTDALGLFLSDGLKVESEKEIGSTKRILEKNDVIISRLRSYLKEISFVFDNENLKLSSTEFFAFRKKGNIDILPELLFSFLQTNIVQKILEWSQEGVNHPRFSDDTILNLKLPDILLKLQDEIKNSVRSGYDLYLNSKVFYQQAENLLLGELDLKDFEKSENLVFIVNLSNILEARRMDAEYFQAKYEKLVSKLKEKNSKLLSEVIESVPAKFEANKKPNNKFNYVELSNINSGVINGFTEVLGRETPDRAKRILKADDVIVSTVEGSLDKVALVDKDQEGFLASNGFFQLRSKEIMPEVLLVMAKSIIFQFQLEKRCAGTILTAVPKESINDIIIPILPKNIQQKISDLVKKSHEARKKSKELLEEAKRKIEEMIEKN